MNCNEDMQASIAHSINLSVPWYLMAAYAYYVEDDPILDDACFDDLARLMLARWGDIEHFHKHLLSKESLGAQTYLGDYPLRTIQALRSLRRSEDGEVQNGK